MRDLKNEDSEINKLIENHLKQKEEIENFKNLELAKYNSASAIYKSMVENPQDFYDMLFKNINSYSAYLSNLIDIFSSHDEFEKCIYLTKFKNIFL